jgi:hypothetical protein
MILTAILLVTLAATSFYIGLECGVWIGQSMKLADAIKGRPASVEEVIAVMREEYTNTTDEDTLSFPEGEHRSG